jgi:hypothetical protein
MNLAPIMILDNLLNGALMIGSIGATIKELQDKIPIHVKEEAMEKSIMMDAMAQQAVMGELRLYHV